MRSTLLGEEIILIVSTPTISIKNRASGRVRECLGLNLLITVIYRYILGLNYIGIDHFSLLFLPFCTNNCYFNII